MGLGYPSNVIWKTGAEAVLCDLFHSYNFIRCKYEDMSGTILFD